MAGGQGQRAGALGRVLQLHHAVVVAAVAQLDLVQAVPVQHLARHARRGRILEALEREARRDQPAAVVGDAVIDLPRTRQHQVHAHGAVHRDRDGFEGGFATVRGVGHHEVAPRGDLAIEGARVPGGDAHVREHLHRKTGIPEGGLGHRAVLEPRLRERRRRVGPRILEDEDIDMAQRGQGTLLEHGADHVADGRVPQREQRLDRRGGVALADGQVAGEGIAAVVVLGGGPVGLVHQPIAVREVRQDRGGGRREQGHQDLGRFAVEGGQEVHRRAGPEAGGQGGAGSGEDRGDPGGVGRGSRVVRRRHARVLRCVGRHGDQRDRPAIHDGLPHAGGSVLGRDAGSEVEVRLARDGRDDGILGRRIDLHDREAMRGAVEPVALDGIDGGPRVRDVVGDAGQPVHRQRAAHRAHALPHVFVDPAIDIEAEARREGRRMGAEEQEVAHDDAAAPVGIDPAVGRAQDDLEEVPAFVERRHLRGFLGAGADRAHPLVGRAVSGDVLGALGQREPVRAVQGAGDRRAALEQRGGLGSQRHRRGLPEERFAGAKGVVRREVERDLQPVQQAEQVQVRFLEHAGQQVGEVVGGQCQARDLQRVQQPVDEVAVQELQHVEDERRVALHPDDGFRAVRAVLQDVDLPVDRLQLKPGVGRLDDLQRVHRVRDQEVRQREGLGERVEALSVAILGFVPLEIDVQHGPAEQAGREGRPRGRDDHADLVVFEEVVPDPALGGRTADEFVLALNALGVETPAIRAGGRGQEGREGRKQGDALHPVPVHGSLPGHQKPSWTPTMAASFFNFFPCNSMRVWYSNVAFRKCSKT